MREASRFRARVDRLRGLFVDDLARWQSVLDANDGRDVDVVIGRHVKPRTLSANAYYWAVVLAYAADWSGNSAQECHEAYRSLYCPTTVVRVPGREVLIRSTRVLSTEEFCTYVNQVVADLHRAGVEVPPAGGVEE